MCMLTIKGSFDFNDAAFCILKLIVRLLYIKQKRLKLIKFLSYIINNHQGHPMDKESIRLVARERALDGYTFSTPPGSPFRALVPYSDPEVEPKCYRGEKEEILSVGHYLNFYA